MRNESIIEMMPECLIYGKIGIKRNAQFSSKIPDEHINLRPSNSQERRTSGISGAIMYWGFLGVLPTSNNSSIT